MADDQRMLFEHRETWKGFCSLMRWSLILIVIVLLGMAAFLV